MWNAIAGLRARRKIGRQGCDQHPQYEKSALASLARLSITLSGAVHLLQRTRPVTRRRPQAGLVRAERGSAAGILRRDLDQLDLGTEQGRRRDKLRSDRLHDHRGKRGGRELAPQSDTGDPNTQEEKG